ncbi:carbohydrate ABC transporter permease [Hoeflea poritis]|uniref:Carbohydrate ABC transporter permease n=1 Tax=Hoeflea poritis TaxID=2993659 RepID=A0ABT4VUX8_9HYPH|nr:carbohydrate ABC transporter permease [Hoeflea poritis]MDA4847822.1 carbohydrate ABC transporter permease [Hoeflea poritis]
MTRKAKRSALCWLGLSPLLIVVLFPYATMLSTALKRKDEIFQFETTWLPDSLYFGNFIELFANRGFGRALLNSLYISFGATLVSLAVALPAAYALSRLRVPGKGTFRTYLLVTQLISPIVLIVGLFRLFAYLGMINDLNALVFAHSAFYMAFAVWMLQSYFDTIPKDLEEAAWMDGASRLKSFRRVFLPLCLPGIAVTSLFTFVNSWNEYAMSLTILREGSLQTAPVKIAFLTGTLYETEWNIIMAATLVATVPVAIVFASIQSYLIRGLSLGGVK